MTNLHPSKDKIGALLNDDVDNSNQFRKKIQQFQLILKKIALSYEGYLLSCIYSISDIPEYLRNDGMYQQEVHKTFYFDAMQELLSIGQEMQSLSKSNREGK